MFEILPIVKRVSRIPPVKIKQVIRTPTNSSKPVEIKSRYRRRTPKSWLRVLTSTAYTANPNEFISFFEAKSYDAFNPHPQNEEHSSESPEGSANYQGRASAGRIMHSHFRILTTPTADTPGTTLALSYNDKNYMFGDFAEGTQRACGQRKFSLAKIEDLFITGKINWAATGGIIGMVLTLADLTTAKTEALKEKASKGKPLPKRTFEPTLRLHGGRNLTHLLATARRFVFRRGLPLYTHEIRERESDAKEWSPVWSDQNIKVWSMVVSPAESSGVQKSARKRSSDEISRDTELPVDLDGKVVRETPEEEQNRHNQVIEAIVREMFRSNWTLDALTRMPLSEVRMPAAIFVRDSEGKIEKYQGPTPGSGQPLPDIEVLCRKPWPASKITKLPPTTPSQAVLSYIVRGHDQRGKFDVKKAVALGVKPGPDFGLLTKGTSVPGKDGTTVTPDMVLDPDQPGGGFAIIAIPSNEYLEPTLDREEWGVKEVMDGIGSVVWVLGSGVRIEGRLEKFMTDHSKWEHVVSSPEYCSNYLALESSASSAIRLHQIASDNFPIPVHTNASAVQWRAEDSTAAKPFQLARIGQMVGVFPSAFIENQNITQYLDTAAVIQEASPELLQLAENARKEVSDPAFIAKLEEQQKDIPSKDAEVIALGTGSALPSKYRNVSATLVRVPGFGNYLLDCGENTYGQMKRVFGKELPDVLRNLKMIWISHLHADHHLGTASIIRAWHELTSQSEQHQKDRLVVSSDDDMLKWLEEYSCIEDYGYDRVERISLTKENNLRHEFNSEGTSAFGLESIVACKVNHCHGALAVALTFPNGFKVAYSGDCRPSHIFAQIGQGATLLIHEATFDDELAGDAIAKKHSTTSEAIDIGRRMGARRILLTHFSQRYQKIPVMNEEEGSEDVKAGVCFDYMRVKVGDIAKLEAYRPALLKLFEVEADEDENVMDLEEVEEEPSKAKKASKKTKKAAKQ